VALRRPGEQRHAAPPAGLGALRSAWGDPFIRRLCALVFMPFGVSVAMMTYTQALLEPDGVSSDAASLMLMLQVVAGVLGCLVVPIWAARARREVAALVSAGVISAVCCALLAVAPGVGTGFVTLTLVGLALLPALPVVLGLAERRTGEAEGTAAALIWLTGQLGGVLVATAVGLLVDSPAPAFLLMAAAAVVALPVAVSLRTPVRELVSTPTA
jgi:predicted MFS family arabinose efflux permease